MSKMEELGFEPWSLSPRPIPLSPHYIVSVRPHHKLMLCSGFLFATNNILCTNRLLAHLGNQESISMLCPAFHFLGEKE